MGQSPSEETQTDHGSRSARSMALKGAGPSGRPVQFQRAISPKTNGRRGLPGLVALGMAGVGFALVPQHGNHFAPLLRGPEPDHRRIEQTALRPRPLVDGGAAARIDDEPHRTPGRGGESDGETARRPDALHAELLAHGRIAVQRPGGRLETPLGVEQKDPGQGVARRSVERSPPCHVGLPDAEHKLQPLRLGGKAQRQEHEKE